jgi:NAD(P)-dependent dehydrogenase (short-subunit alcohol dehydrogenase family)
MDKQAVCIVAGVGPGMGLALARRFARGGFAVALLARSQEQLDKYSAQIALEGGTARGFAVDLTDTASLQGALARVAAEMGEAQVAIYNASLWRPAHPMQFDPKQFAADLALGATGALVMAQAVYPAMRRAGSGSLLFTGGGLALHPEAGGEVLALTAGKAALRAMVLAMAPVLAQEGIGCTTVTVDGAIAPGTAFDPDKIAERFWQVQAMAPAVRPAEVLYTGA